MIKEKKLLPLIPLRDVVIYPEFIVPLFIGRQKSINAIENAMTTDKMVVLVTQRDSTIDVVKPETLYDVGTVCMIDQTIKLTDGTIKILANGLYRADIISKIDDEEMMRAEIMAARIERYDSKELEGLRLALVSNFESFFKQNKKLPLDILNSISSMEDCSKLADTIASYIPLKVSERQKILETTSVKDRLEKLIYMMEEKSELVIVEKKIKNRVKKQVEKNQKEYYLNEQLKAIYKELGDGEDLNQEVRELEQKVKQSKMSKEAKTKALAEVKKLRNMPQMSQEGGIIRTYLDWLLSLPWTHSKKSNSLQTAEEVLNKTHYGLNKIKDRIMEYLSVQKRVKKMKAQIMCFVGPPGVGKTSLGKAIAEATGKNFVRVALGGVNDESEIRGHRRTYIGSMPGKIIQAFKRAKSTNPIIMLDEIDKLGSDWRGDPASALLEVLDPEQNQAFVDHYIEVPYDLSETMFITTANSLDIPHALLDRMEVINLSGYTEEEKLNIVKKYIIPKQLEQNGLKTTEIKFTDNAIAKIIRNYTMESGVRNLEREISKICRKVVRRILSNKDIESVTVDESNISEFLGAEKFTQLTASKDPRIGVVTGLAWTESGGDVLEIETLPTFGSGNITSTGKLGEVMQESVKAAYSYVKSRYIELGLNQDDLEKTDIHVHVPEGAVPKDGPSAGITICTSIVSALTKRPVKSDIAMTGEITLTGNVLAIGGLKEKLLAARRSGIKKVFIPQENEKDISELPDVIKEAIEIKCVKHIDEVLSEAFAK
ncbi:MAG: endopeptidase La [Alphaproteobacteria bacterium]|nr:endopeptidase La [Alphaproteobacteria bacterium]